MQICCSEKLDSKQSLTSCIGFRTRKERTAAFTTIQVARKMRLLRPTVGAYGDRPR